jgi:hypothetical protein
LTWSLATGSCLSPSQADWKSAREASSSSKASALPDAASRAFLAICCETTRNSEASVMFSCAWFAVVADNRKLASARATKMASPI